MVEGSQSLGAEEDEMSGWDILGFVISALVWAMVAILVTGKINAGFDDRRDARRLRQRATRALLIGPEQQPFSQSLGKSSRLTKEQLDEV